VNQDVLYAVSQRLADHLGLAAWQRSLVDLESAILSTFMARINIHARGRDLGIITVDWSAIGIPADSKRAQLLLHPRLDLFPRPTRKKLSSLINRARARLRRHAIAVPGSSFYHLTLEQYQRWKPLFEEDAAEFERVKQEELVEPYASLREQAGAIVEQAALEAHRSLVTAGLEVSLDRVRRQLARQALQRFPAREMVISGMTLGLQAIDPPTEELAGAILALAEKAEAELEGERARARHQERLALAELQTADEARQAARLARITQQDLLEEMRRQMADVYQSTMEDDLSEIEQVVQAATGQINAALVRVLESLGDNGEPSRGTLRSLEAAVDVWRGLRSLVGQNEVDDLMTELRRMAAQTKARRPSGQLRETLDRLVTMTGQAAREEQIRQRRRRADRSLVLLGAVEEVECEV
jgi:hypothetical protein